MPDDTILPPDVRQIDYMTYVVHLRRWCFEMAARDFQAIDARSPDNFDAIVALAKKIEDWLFEGQTLILK